MADPEDGIFAPRGHGRFGYRGLRGRAAYDWPNRTRLAVYIGLNIEHFAFGEGLGAELAPAAGQPDVLNYAWREYGNRIGVWRLLDLFDSLALPASVIVNSAIYDHCPEVMDAVRARGDEVVGHGRSNAERQGGLDPAEERRLIAQATRRIAQAEGAPPRGWLGPWISESHATPDLLAACGYAYVLDWCMDDQPVWLRSPAGSGAEPSGAERSGAGGLLAVPYPQELNDIPAIVARKDSASQFADMIVDQFDEMLEQATDLPLVMGIALHPYIVGQPHRLRHLRRALRHVAQARERIWMTRAGDIAAFCLAAPGRFV